MYSFLETNKKVKKYRPTDSYVILWKGRQMKNKFLAESLVRFLCPITAHLRPQKKEGKDNRRRGRTGYSPREKKKTSTKQGGQTAEGPLENKKIWKMRPTTQPTWDTGIDCPCEGKKN